MGGLTADQINKMEKNRPSCAKSCATMVPPLSGYAQVEIAALVWRAEATQAGKHEKRTRSRAWAAFINHGLRAADAQASPRQPVRATLAGIAAEKASSRPRWVISKKTQEFCRLYWSGVCGQRSIPLKRGAIGEFSGGYAGRPKCGRAVLILSLSVSFAEASVDLVVDGDFATTPGAGTAHNGPLWGRRRPDSWEPLGWWVTAFTFRGREAWMLLALIGARLLVAQLEHKALIWTEITLGPFPRPSTR